MMTSSNRGFTPTTASLSWHLQLQLCVDVLKHCIDRHTHVMSSGLAVRNWKTRVSSYSGGSRTTVSNHWKYHLKPLLSISPCIIRIHSLMSSSDCGPNMLAARSFVFCVVLTISFQMKTLSSAVPVAAKPRWGQPQCSSLRQTVALWPRAPNPSEELLRSNITTDRKTLT